MEGMGYQNPLQVSLNKYLYNGKELQDDLGLDWYDYGFRMYDPQLGRFPSIDPIAEELPHLSPYNYASNDPIKFIDLHGLQGVLPPIPGSKKLYREGLQELREAGGGNSFVEFATGFLSVGEMFFSDPTTDQEDRLSTAADVGTSLGEGEYGEAALTASGVGGTLSLVGGILDGDWNSIGTGAGIVVTAIVLRKTVKHFRKKGSIYEVPGDGTKSGLPYGGRHNKPNPSKTRKSKDGRDRTKAKKIGRYDTNKPTEGAFKEEKYIRKKGLDNLDNKRHEMNNSRYRKALRKYSWWNPFN